MSPPPGHIKINTISNDGFEDAGTNGVPLDFDGYTNGYVFTSINYTENAANGSFAACIEAQTVPLCSGGYETSSISANLPDSPLIQFSSGVLLSFNWFVSSCPADGSYASALVIVENDVGESKRVWYYLSSASTPDTNRSTDGCFVVHGDLQTWHHFERNVTHDYIAVFGGGSIDSTLYVSYLSFRVESDQTNAPLTGMVYDDVVLDNGASDDWITNGDFEMNDYVGWICHVRETPAYITQSNDCTEGDYSLNITSGITDHSSTNCHLGQDLPYGQVLLAGPRSVILRFDWKYSFTESASERTWLRVILRNDTGGSSIRFLLGNSSFKSHEENEFILEMDSPGVWQHTEIDINEYATLCNISNVWIQRVEFYLLAIFHGGASLLVDNLQVFSLAAGDPGFEAVRGADFPYEIPGWTGGGMANVSFCQESYSGEFAVNMTALDNQYGGLERGLRSGYHSSDRIRLAWRLEDMAAGSDAYAMARLSIYSGPRISFLLGCGNASRWSNSSNHVYLFADGYNSTGEWHSLELTMDTVRTLLNLTESEMAASALSVSLHVNSGENETVSLLVDDVEIIDSLDPVVQVEGPSEITEGALGETLNWTSADSHPYKLVLYCNGSSFAESPWYVSPEFLALSLDSLGPGFYNLTLLAIDSGGNTGESYVGLMVEPHDSMTTVNGWHVDPIAMAVSVTSAVVIVVAATLTVKKRKVRIRS
jgi:hypothetical protein